MQSDVSHEADGQGERPRQDASAASSHLPFTGLDLGLLLGVGLGLVLIGAGLSRLTASAAEDRQG